MKEWLFWFAVINLVAAVGARQTRWPWFRFACVELFQLEAMFLGWLVLIPFCLLKAWKPGAKSIKDGRPIDVWSWGPLNLVSGNPEDGASGQFALINGNQPYMPNTWAPWRAYLWSAWRNSANNLKYVFAWTAGPYKEWSYSLFGKLRTAKIGWQMENGFNVSVISL